MADITVLLTRIEKRLKKTGEKPSRFGRKAANNSTLIDRMKAGNVTVRTLQRVEKYLDESEKAA